MTAGDPSGEIQKIRAEVRQDRRRGAYFWLVMVLTSASAGGGAIGFSAYNTRQSERKLCSVVILSDDYFRRVPPTVQIQKDQAANFRNLRRDLGCPHTEVRQ